MARRKATAVSPIIVIWEDAATHEDEPTTVLTASVGYPVPSDKTKIALAQAFDVQGDYQDIITIPAGMVRRVIKLRRVVLTEFNPS